MNSEYPAVVSEQESRQAAAEAWGTLVRFWMEHNRFLQAANEIGLGPPHAKALLSLTADEPPPMGMLAEHLSCDASFITAIVDRLEEEGYVERRPSPVDRRVKTVVITKAGQRARERLEAAMFQPPKELLDLPEADLKTLRRITAKLPGGADHRHR
jgi:DNA-binding MarR family transcriptional regulator